VKKPQPYSKLSRGDNSTTALDSTYLETTVLKMERINSASTQAFTDREKSKEELDKTADIALPVVL
jgi:hypothetical protein